MQKIFQMQKKRFQTEKFKTQKNRKASQSVSRR